MSAGTVKHSNHLILCHPFLLLPSIFPSIRFSPSELALCIRCPKYWSFSISPSIKYSEMISFRIGWFYLLAVHGTLESSLAPQFESANFSKLSFLYGPTPTSIYNYWKNHSCDYPVFVGKVMSLLFNTLSRLVIAILTRSKSLLIPWLQSPSALNLESKKVISDTVSMFSPSICHEMMGPDAMILVF